MLFQEGFGQCLNITPIAAHETTRTCPQPPEVWFYFFISTYQICD